MQNLNNTYKQISYVEKLFSAASIIDNQDQDQDFNKEGSDTFRNEHWLS
jgi:hypothetical protein